jgi:hypothetical protein
LLVVSFRFVATAFSIRADARQFSRAATKLGPRIRIGTREMVGAIC